MTVTAWRLVKKKHLESAFDGEGARLYGGRWNSPGKRVVYASEATSLSILELLVHVDGSLLANYTAIPVEFDDSAVSVVEVDELPDNWRQHPGPSGLRRIGDDWLESGSSPALKLPRVLVPHEWNYLFSPEHPDFPSVKLGTPVTFDIDLRLLGG